MRSVMQGSILSPGYSRLLYIHGDVGPGVVVDSTSGTCVVRTMKSHKLGQTMEEWCKYWPALPHGAGHYVLYPLGSWGKECTQTDTLHNLV